MAKEIDWETRQLAEELYITEGLTYEEVVEKTGVSVSQLKRWGADGSWTDRKREYRQSLSDIRRNTVRLRADLLSNAIGSLDPQAVYAFAAIERACAPKAPKTPENGIAEPVGISRVINTPEEAMEAIREVLELRINGMLTKPDAVNPKAIYDLLKLIENVQVLEHRYAEDAGDKEGKHPSNTGVSDETIKAIRRDVLRMAE